MNAVTPTYPMRRNDNDELVADWTKIDTPVKHLGKELILPGDPENMDYDTAINTLQRVKKAESQKYGVKEQVKGLPWDAAVATFLAMQEIYGVVLPQTMYTWFGKRNPTFMTVKTGPDAKDVIQVPIGEISLPGMADNCFVQAFPGGVIIQGEVTKKDRARIVEIAIKAREIIKTRSIYKGKAIKLNVDDDGNIDVNEQPEFFDVRHVQETDMIHNRITESIIQTAILSPIKNTEACRKHKIPLKRGVLLEGTYGTGKTLTARVTAKVAQDNGWTFIVLARCQGLASALKVAERYQPAVVFAEDIDRFAERAKEKVNDLVNLIDGLVPSGAAVMTVLTTNYIDKIDKALLRPGRLDAVISIDAPEADTVERLVRFYGAELLSADVDTKAVGKLMAGQIPATIAEVVKRAKLAMLTEDRDHLTETDLLTAGTSMKRHLDLLSVKEPAPADGVVLLNILRQAVLDAVMPDTEEGETLGEVVQAINEKQQVILNYVS